MVPLFVGLGTEDGILPGTVVAMLCHQCGISGADLGRITLFPRHCLLGVKAEVVDRIFDHPVHHRGRPVPVRQDRVAAMGVAPRRGPPSYGQRSYGPPKRGGPGKFQRRD
jgi:hypothetical protein